MMTMSAMLLIGIAIAVLLYIVVQRLDRIISVQLDQKELQKEQRFHLISIANLLRVPYGEEVDRRWREKEDRDLQKAIADFGNGPQQPPKG
jgi:hypothetical protein